MTSIQQIVGSITPGMEHLIEYLALSGQPEALAFFQQMRDRLDNVQEEDDLLELFMLLSMTAFQGFQMDPTGAMLADGVLSYAEEIAHTFSADDATAH